VRKIDFNLIVLGGLVILLIISGILCIESGELMHAVFFLGVLLVTIGEIYILLGAEFIGVVQILVYAGGVTVLMLFTLLFIPKTRERLEKPFLRWPGLVTILLLMSIILMSIGYVTEVTVGPVISVIDLAQSVINGYLLLVALIGLVVFIVMIASAYISSVRRE